MDSIQARYFRQGSSKRGHVFLSVDGRSDGAHRPRSPRTVYRCFFANARCAAGRVDKISMGQRNRSYRDVRHCRFLGIRSLFGLEKRRQQGTVHAGRDIAAAERCDSYCLHGFRRVGRIWIASRKRFGPVPCYLSCSLSRRSFALPTGCARRSFGKRRHSDTSHALPI